MLVNSTPYKCPWHAKAYGLAMGSADPADPQNLSDRQDSRLKKDARPLSLVIAGGGTGGHLFPGIAVAEQVLRLHTDSQILFIGTGNPFETRILNQNSFAHDHIRVKPLKGKSKFHQALALAAIPASVAASFHILRKIRPDVVLGVGGYSAGPVVLAAWILGIPRALHEQNLIPGMTNRFLAPFANRIYVSFDNTRIGSTGHKIRLTGNPVRKDIFNETQSAAPDTDTDSSQRNQNRFTILIIGGSQGAHRINMTIIASLEYLKSRHNLFFIHQTGSDDESEVSQAYRAHNIAATVQPFFDDMKTCYGQADLVICRAGASTMAELALLGKRVIFIPYPFAADDHQAVNAAQLVSAGAAEMILEKDLTAMGLAEVIAAHVDSPQKGRIMAANLKKQGRPHADRDIVADLYELVGSRQ